jgi:hypothetical protein
MEISNSSLPRVAVISTVKVPLDQLRMYVNYHFNIGIDEFILFFDDPDDPGIEAMSAYRGLTAITCSDAYWAEIPGGKPGILSDQQVENLKIGVEIAKRNNCEWVIHIDTDELLNPLKDIKTVLADCDADSLRFDLLEAVSGQEYYNNIFEPILFRQESSKQKIRLAERLGCSKAIWNQEFIRGHHLSKSATRLGPSVNYIDVHMPKGHEESMLRKNCKEIQLLHFDCVGLKDWDSKWSNRTLDGSDLSNPKLKPNRHRKNRIKQHYAYLEAKASGRVEMLELYQAMYAIPKREQFVLWLLGMLKRVKIDRRLFSAPGHVDLS